MQLWCPEQPMLEYLPLYPSLPHLPSTHPWGQHKLLIWICISSISYFHVFIFFIELWFMFSSIFIFIYMAVVVSLIQDVCGKKAEERLIKIFPPKVEIKCVTIVSDQPKKWGWKCLKEQNGSQSKHKAFQSAWTTAYCEVCLLPQTTKENHRNQRWWKNRY